MKHPRLKTFIYLLLRDEITVGSMERMIKIAHETTSFSLHYNNKLLEQYSEEIVERLLDE